MASKKTGGTLGTFAGVFTPSVLTILGIILFLRVGNVVGSAGLGRALLIILVANAISVLTSISLAAVATNFRVKGGGDYYLISRTLGVEYGGALGLVLFLAQSVSIAFYAIGFGEAVATIVGRGPAALPQIVAAVAVAALFVLAWLGSDQATRFQYAVMAVLFTAIVGFFVGGLGSFEVGTLRDNIAPGSDTAFWAIFALFFPAVTGFTQGVSMSGDLKDPGKSLPLGTFLAVGISLVVYVGAAVVFAGALPSAILTTDNSAMRQISISARLVDAGVIAATLSSALASFLGAPRILQSLARDKVFPVLNLFAAGHGASNNPRRGVLLSAAIAFGTIALGDLDVIAPVVSMFFLISYGLLNYATYVEAKANSPSFRPRFRFFHQRLSLLGCLACLGAMLAIHPTAGAVAMASLFAVRQYVSRSVAGERWADSERSRRFQRLREDVQRISREPEHPRYWRPIQLAVSEDAGHRRTLLRFAQWLEGNSGLTVAVRLLQGEGAEARKRQVEVEKELRLELDKAKIRAFPRVIVTPQVDGAFPVLLQSYGLGPVRANTVLLSWFERRESAEVTAGARALVGYPRQALRCGANLVILAAGESDVTSLETVRAERRTIDVWYRDNATGRLSLLLAYLMTRCDEWEHAKLRVFAPARKDSDPDHDLAQLREMLEEVRIEAEPEIVDDTESATIVRHSCSSTVVFLPLRLQDDLPVCAYGGDLDELTTALGITVLVLAAQDIVLDTEPETGQIAEQVEAVDTATKALKTLRKVETETTKVEQAASKLEEKLDEKRREGFEELEVPDLERAVSAAQSEVERAKRRLARARAKTEAAVKEAEELTGRSLSGDEPGSEEPEAGQ